MPRPVKFTEEQILDVSRNLVVDEGPTALTMMAVGRALAAPSGSLYHRFPSVDVLAASVWIRAVERFQEGYLVEIARTDPLQAALGAAAHVVSWSRANLNDARLLLQFRSRDLRHGSWPEALRKEDRRLQRRVGAAVRSLQARFGAGDEASRHRVSFAVIDLPYAAVRPALVAGRPPLPTTDALVADTVTHVLQPLVDRQRGRTTR